MKLLKINMGSLSVKVEMKLEYERLGGRALTSKILYDEVPPTCHPLGPNNKLIIAPGILTGSGASSTDRYSIGAKSPLTGGIKESNAGGIAGIALGKLGYAALIFENIRDDFQVVHIGKDGVTFKDATPILGKNNSDATRWLRDQYGNDVAILIIGISGECKMNIAAIAGSDKEGFPTRFNGRGGLGAVMGAKGIKAIVLNPNGVEKKKPYNQGKLKEMVKQYHRWLLDTPATNSIFPQLGTASLVETTNRLGALPTRNFSTGSIRNYMNITGEALRETILKRKGEGTTTHACMPGCIIRCSNVFADDEGNRVTGPIEYENIGLLGANLEISNLDDIAQLNHLCNEYGTDTIETGGALGVLMEANVLPFGDAESAISAVKDIKKGTTLGRIIGSGAEIIGKIYGLRHVPTVKGQTMPAYDPRAIKGLGVTYATSPMGADHTAGQTVRAQIDHHQAEGQVEISKQAQTVNTIWDILGICMFTSGAVLNHLEQLAELVSAYTGKNVKENDIIALANETLKVEHAFNRNAGFTKADDQLAEYFYEEKNSASNTLFDVNPQEMHSIGVERMDL